MSGRSSDKVVIIIGADSELGSNAALRFAQSGARVVLTGHEASRLEALAAEIGHMGGSALVVRGMIGDEVAASSCVDRTLLEFGRIDALVAAEEPSEHTVSDPFACDDAPQALSRAFFLLTRASLPELRARHGAVVGLWSAEHGKRAAAGVYQRWMRAFIRGLAVGQAKHGVRANAVCVVDDSARRMTLLDDPSVRFAEPGTEYASLTELLTSDATSWVTGTVYLVRAPEGSKDVSVNAA